MGSRKNAGKKKSVQEAEKNGHRGTEGWEDERREKRGSEDPPLQKIEIPWHVGRLRKEHIARDEDDASDVLIMLRRLRHG
jgi:hypothetical protein